MRVIDRKINEDGQYAVWSSYKLFNGGCHVGINVIAAFINKEDDGHVIIGTINKDGREKIYTVYKEVVKIVDHISEIPGIPEEMKDVSLQIVNEHIDLSDRIWTLEERIIAFMNNLK